MNKLWLIIAREYTTRVKKRSFLLTTLLAPVALAIFMVFVGLIFSYNDSDVKNVLIVDESQLLQNKIKDQRHFYFSFSDKELKEILENPAVMNGQSVLFIPALKDVSTKKHTVFYYSDDPLDLESSEMLQRVLEEKIRNFKIQELKIDPQILDQLDVQVTLDPEPLQPSDPGSSSKENPTPMTTIIAAAIGGLMGFAMYMIVFINGVMVMRSVMEEKMNRVVEVMISSVKPFQLMMGKIIGVGGVGLTQIIIWIILIPLISFGANVIFGFDTSPAGIAEGGALVDPEELDQVISEIMVEVKSIHWWVLIPCFVIFFLGGYIIYASLFAAVGSAVGDDQAESQALTLPLTLPVIIALYIMFAALRVPNSPLAIWASLFPLFSPIVMPARLAFQPPVWQIVLSILLLILAAVFCVWISGRIYRTGILLYGKKGTFKEIWKWLVAKNG